MSGWDLIKEIVDFNYTGQVTRQSLLYEMRGNTYKCSENTIDHYRLMLTWAGYLKHVARGIYAVVARPPKNMTYKQCRKKATKNSKAYQLKNKTQ